MQHLRTSWYFLTFLLLLFTAAWARAEITVEASLSHLSFPVDQGSLLTITVTGTNRISAILLPEVQGIRFQNRGQSSRINLVNGSMSSFLSNSYLIQAQKPGTYTLPPIQVKAGAESASSQAISFEVTAVTQGNAPEGSGDRSLEEVAFIRITGVSDHYPGEIVPITIKAYFNQKYRADINSLPTMNGDGVVMPQLREKPGQTQERIGNATYHVLSWHTTLSGIKAGEHPITFSMQASLLAPQKRRPGSPFGGGMLDDSLLNDPFFDSFFGGAQRTPIEVVSNKTIFKVVPLPNANQPKNFSGAIGVFDLQVSANRQELEVGEPITLKLEVSGSGNFDRVEAPPFADSTDWKTYTPAATFASQGNSYTGVKVFEMAIVAKHDGVTEIPALSFSFFDPGKKDYVTRTSPPIGVKLHKGVSSPPQPTPTPKAPEPPAGPAAVEPAGDVLHMAPLNLELGTFQHKITPIFVRPWFVGIAAFCVAVIGVCLLWQLRRQYLIQHPEKHLRQRKKNQLTHDLGKAEQACMAGNGALFFDLAKQAMQNQFGLAWNTAPTTISLADLKNRIGTDSPLVEIFAAADAAAYGGAMPSPEKMQEYCRILQKELEVLQ